MENFLDIVLPPVLLAAGVIAVTVSMCVLTAGRLRLWAARRRRIYATREALQAVADALAGLIAEPLLREAARNAAVDAYGKLKAVLATAEKEREK